MCQKDEQITAPTCQSKIKPSSCTNIDQNQQEACFQENINCNDFCDSPNKCKDEAYCNGFIYGRFCEVNNFYLPVLRLADLTHFDKRRNCKVFDPWPGNSTAFLQNYTGPVCEHSISKKTFPIFNFTRCAAFQYDLSALFDPTKWWITSTKMHQHDGSNKLHRFIKSGVFLQGERI